MSRKPVVSRHTEYGIVTYTYLDISSNRTYTESSIFYPADINRRKIEYRIKKYLNSKRDGGYLHLLGIDSIEKEVKDLKIPVEVYIKTCLEYEEEKACTNQS